MSTYQRENSKHWRASGYEFAQKQSATWRRQEDTALVQLLGEEALVLGRDGDTEILEGEEMTALLDEELCEVAPDEEETTRG